MQGDMEWQICDTMIGKNEVTVGYGFVCLRWYGYAVDNTMNYQYNQYIQYNFSITQDSLSFNT